MAAAPSTDEPLQWCRERLLVPGHPLALTLPYADPSLRDPLVALSAVVGDIAAVPGEVSDPDVARRKLEWWREALAEGLPHPAVQAWLKSGAGERVSSEAFDALIEAVAAEIDPPRFEQPESLDRHCRAVAGAGALLEARLVEPASGSRRDFTASIAAAAGAGYRIRIVRDLVLDARGQRWMVPLELQAEFQLTRQEVAAGDNSRRLEALVRQMAVDAVMDLDRALDALPAGDRWQHRHLLLRMHLDRRIGRALVRRPARVTRERIPVGGPTDAFSLWRRARRLRKGGSSRN